MQSAITLTVSQLNEYIKALLDSSELLGNIYIKGEISNFTNHYKTGHLYFSLKDESALLKAVMFRSSKVKLKFIPENGMKVIVRGRISVFPRDGVYQMYAEEIQPDGVGALYLAYEQLKERLFLSGLFDEDHKIPIPRYPEKIGIITANTGAAVADMKNIISRRYPPAEIIIYPSLVQGNGAPEELAAGIRFFNEKLPVDTIIIGRGGGSIEDLWAFNSEMLAHEIYKSKIPVISAVGHETDFTICDFVADLRAPTPSAAAELAVPEINDIKYRLNQSFSSLHTHIIGKITACRTELALVSKNKIFENPINYTKRFHEKTDEFANMIYSSGIKILQAKKSLVSEKAAALSALSPLAVMSRGYSVVTAEDGKVISDAGKLSAGDPVEILFHKGRAEATVTKIIKGGKTDARKKEN